MSKFDPTDEQLRAVEAAKTGQNVVITACAGAGKTSTLRLIADALGTEGVYVAYNRAIADDAARSFPATVICRTAHSFAYRAVGHRYRSRLTAPRMTGRQLAQILDIDRSYPLGDDRELAPQRVASLIMATINRWCHSADERILSKHAAAVVHDIPGAEDVSWELSTYLAAEAQRAWDTDLSRENGRLPFSHDMYVKLWALQSPRLPGDFILYDEAQDADPCIASVVLAQEGKQLIAVGDECQAIYGWRGATDAMRTWPAAHRVSLTKSFRFGPPVADEANVFLGLLGAEIRVKGYEKLTTTVGPVSRPDAILCRTNASVIEEALAIRDGRSFAVVGGMDAIYRFAEAAEALMDGRRASWHPDLGAFKSWSDVMDYVHNDEGGSDLRSMVNIVDDFGPQGIYEVCGRAVKNESNADVVLSTAHKSKGREWNAVKIANDFQPSSSDDGQISRPEAMLMYVAVTRAMKALDCKALEWAKEVETCSSM